MSEPNNDRQHLTDHTLSPALAAKIPFKTFPADRTSDDKTFEDRIQAAVLAERAKHDYEHHVLLKLWEIARPSEDSDYDTNNFYDYVREGVAAKRRLAEGERAIKEFVSESIGKAFNDFDNADSAVVVPLFWQNGRRHAEIADGILVAAGRLRRGYGHLHPGIESFVEAFERAARQIRSGE